MLYRLLKDRAKRFPDKIAVAGELSSLSYAALLSEVEKKAAFLLTLDLRANDSILVGLPPCPDLYVLFYAAGVTGITIIPTLPSERIPASVLTAKPVLAFGEASLLGEVRGEFPDLRGSFAWTRKSGLQIPDPRLPFRRKKVIREEKIAAVSSSGTTGAPSLHYRSAEMLVERARLRAETLGIVAEDVPLAARPFNNGSSINNYVMIPIVAGCKVVVRERFERFGMLRSLAGEKVTVLFGVPFIFEMLASVPPGYRANLSPLRLCISAGAPLSNSVAERFYRRFAVPVRQAYGASHIHPIFTYSLSGVPGTVGHASGPFPAAIMDDRGITLTAGEVGETVFDYARLSSRWERYLRDNPHRMGRYIHSGDLGRIDRDGNLYVVGRKSSFIKVGGNRVEAAEVEDVLRAHPQVSDALVFAHHPGRPDEAVAAVVVTESALSAEEILRHCERRLEGYKCPRMIRFTDNPPRNAHGKIHRGLFEPAPETG